MAAKAELLLPYVMHEAAWQRKLKVVQRIEQK